MGILTVFLEVAYQSILPVLVGREHLVGSNSKLEFSLSLRSPVQGWPEDGYSSSPHPLAIAVDAVSFLASAASLLLIGRSSPSPRGSDHTDFGAR